MAPSSEHDRAHSDAAVLGAAVRARRRLLHLTQAELAALAGCARRSVTALETGKPTVRLDIVLAVLGVLGLRLRVGPGRGSAIVSSDE